MIFILKTIIHYFKHIRINSIRQVFNSIIIIGWIFIYPSMTFMCLFQAKFVTNIEEILHINNSIPDNPLHVCGL